MIHKWHDGAAALEKSMPKIYARNVGKLVVRNIEQPRQLDSVRTRLIEHQKKFAVCKHCAGGMGLQQIIDVLRQPRAAGPVFAHSFPEGEQEIGAVLVLKQQVDFVDIKPCILTELAIADDTIEHAVQYDQHTDRQELLAEVTDVIAKNAGIGVHVRVLGKRIQAAFREQLQCQRNVPRFRFRLLQERGMEVL